ncbi:segregation/condensation protein A [Anaerococcus sp. AGMB09787]|uniref:segregation and condensation protein A n=1 Tax=Anaerococcus sp. AGMB09787 TaxID=2922869 RepID=UPI001FAFE2DF|nr:segregation/condensation protein A [Anaerococcus sp. AGMB09787]
MSDKLNIELESFSGPFDLLLSLIEKKKIDIYDIALEDITNSYLEEINKLSDIDNLSEFIYIASILLTIKANKLTPKEENENLEEEFISYLITYKKIKSVEDDLKLMEAEARKIYSKYQEDLSQFEVYDEVKIENDINILKTKFEKVLKNLGKKSPKPFFEPTRIEDVNEYVEKIRKTLNFAKTLRLDNITTRIRSKSECIATFLALLELVRLREIELEEKVENSFFVIKR